MRCDWINTSGPQCVNDAMEGSDYCEVHAPLVYGRREELTDWLRRQLAKPSIPMAAE